jgi:RNA polymerase sigma-70 factor (ECF subfamily)
LLPLSEAVQRAPCHRPSVSETLEKQEREERLHEALHRLRSAEKEVFLLRQNGELTYGEIARLRACPVGTVKSQMRSALAKLRQVFQNE